MIFITDSRLSIRRRETTNSVRRAILHRKPVQLQEDSSSKNTLSTGSSYLSNVHHRKTMNFGVCNEDIYMKSYGHNTKKTQIVTKPLPKIDQFNKLNMKW